MKGIYEMNFDCGRIGSLEGIFVADSADVEKAIGLDIYFGEVLGKHSEIVGPLDPEDITLVTDDPKAVEMFEKYNFASGYDPFDYIEDEVKNLWEK